MSETNTLRSNLLRLPQSVRKCINDFVFPNPFQDRIAGRDLFCLNEMNLHSHSWLRLRTVKEFLLSPRDYRDGEVWKVIEYLRPKNSPYPERWKFYPIPERQLEAWMSNRIYNGQYDEIDVETTFLCELGFESINLWMFACQDRSPEAGIFLSPARTWHGPRQQPNVVDRTLRRVASKIIRAVRCYMFRKRIQDRIQVRREQLLEEERRVRPRLEGS